MRDVILASGSATRIRLLQNAGLVFSAEPSTIDERAVEAPLLQAGETASEVALALADAKADDVAANHPGMLVIGADQTMELAGARFSKPASRDEAADQLAQLSGQVHYLHTAAVIRTDGARVWEHVVSARLAMRDLSADEIGGYLDKVGDAAFSSVGGYQIEGPGLQLFDDIHGDYFAILGLPMLPLLAALRQQGAL